MTKSFSAYLDALRFFAAFLVVMSHFAYPRFTQGRWISIRELNLGSDAVIVFFVLSGLVISYSVQNKLVSPGQYTFDRLTRLYSVSVPALIFGFVLDRSGSFISLEHYDGWYYNPVPLWELLLRGLTFSTEWTGLQTRLGTNGPYWSLSYEAAYYALFGILIFTQGLLRIFLLAGGALIAGINVLLLLPCWLLGVALQSKLFIGRLPDKRVALALALTPAALYAIALVTGLPNILSLQYSVAVQVLRFSDEFVWNNILALLVVVHLFGMAGLLKSQKTHFRRGVRWLAGGSFSLYLVHYPALQFFAAVGIAGSNLLHDVALLGATCILCFVFAAFFERPLARLRTAVRPFFFRHSTANVRDIGNG